MASARCVGMRSIAVFASLVSSIAAGTTSSPCPRHSSATASARSRLGSTRDARAGVLIALPSSITPKPPSAVTTETSL